LKKHIILFLAANPLGTAELALGREARAIHEELERSGQRHRFELVTRWAVQPLDLIRELRKLMPIVVHFSGHGGNGARQLCGRPRRDVVDEPGGDIGAEDNDHQAGLLFQRPDGQPHLVGATALRAAFRAAGMSVKLVVFNACYSDIYAEALLVHVDCVVGVRGSLRDDAARSFAIGFYGGLGERQSVAAAYLQGCAAIILEDPSAFEMPQLRVRDGVDADQLILAEGAADKQRRSMAKWRRWWMRAVPSAVAAAVVAMAVLVLTRPLAEPLALNPDQGGVVGRRDRALDDRDVLAYGQAR